MRVIGGHLRGRRLKPPSGRRVRPTGDRVRETLFNMLASIMTDGNGAPFEGTRVADIFAGTGALGIEALSRGASHATFVDVHPDSLALVKENVTALGLEAHATVVRSDARRLPAATRPSDILFLDPPYGENLLPSALSGLKARGWTRPDSIIVVETARGEDLALPDWLRPEKERDIGDTRLVIARVTG